MLRIHPKLFCEHLQHLLHLFVGHVNYSVAVAGGDATAINVLVLDADEQVVAQSNKLSDVLSVPFPKLWWPYGMNDSVGYLYKLLVCAVI